jgi:hypothetical protein
MRQLISHPGLRFIITTLKGTIRYTHTRKGKAPKKCVLTDSDFEDDETDSQSDDGTRALQMSINVSAVGFEMCLSKNDGLLKVEFEGSSGEANWEFAGLLEGSDKAMVASVGVQTDKMIVKETGIQTEAVARKETGVQTKVDREENMSKPTNDSHTQTEIPVKPDPDAHHPAATEVSKINMATALQPSTTEAPEASDSILSPASKKRKFSSSPAPFDDQARSAYDSTPWPRHLFIRGYRVYPIFKGDNGKLHIDLATATVWYDGWYGKEHMRCKEKKQIDLTNKLSKF